MEKIFFNQSRLFTLSNRMFTFLPNVNENQRNKTKVIGSGYLRNKNKHGERTQDKPKQDPITISSTA